MLEASLGRSGKQQHQQHGHSFLAEPCVEHISDVGPDSSSCLNLIFLTLNETTLPAPQNAIPRVPRGPISDSGCISGCSRVGRIFHPVGDVSNLRFLDSHCIESSLLSSTDYIPPIVYGVHAHHALTAYLKSPLYNALHPFRSLKFNVSWVWGGHGQKW